VKTGAKHLQSLRDGREVYIRGERVADVTAHPAFRNSVRSAAQLYDFQNEHAGKMTFVSPDTGERVSRCWQLSRGYDELVTRREALAAWAGTHFGFMGRSPDHVASCISGMYMAMARLYCPASRPVKTKAPATSVEVVRMRPVSTWLSEISAPATGSELGPGPCRQSSR